MPSEEFNLFLVFEDFLKHLLQSIGEWNPPFKCNCVFLSVSSLFVTDVTFTMKRVSRALENTVLHCSAEPSKAAPGPPPTSGRRLKRGGAKEGQGIGSQEGRGKGETGTACLPPPRASHPAQWLCSPRLKCALIY